MQDNQVSISSVTGVDIQLEIAGPGSRAFAFVVDWHIRFIVALAWFLIGWVLAVGSWTLPDSALEEPGFLWLAVTPAAVIYLFYHPLLEILMRGRTPGKRIAGVRIVTREGDSPGVGALLIRNVFRIVDGLPGLYAVGFVATIVTTQHVRVGDMAAGTLLIVEHDDDSLRRLGQGGRNPNLDPKIAELIDEILTRWDSLAHRKRAEIAAALLAKINKEQEAGYFSRLSEAELRERLTRLLRVETDRPG